MKNEELKEFYNKLNFKEKAYIAHLTIRDKEYELIMLTMMDYKNKDKKEN